MEETVDKTCVEIHVSEPEKKNLVLQDKGQWKVINKFVLSWDESSLQGRVQGWPCVGLGSAVAASTNC